MASSRSILYWNANSLNSAKLAELESLTMESNPLCVIVSETKHVNDGDVKELNGYSTMGKPYRERQGGLVVYLSDRLQGVVRRADLEKSPHVLAFECSLRSRRLIVLGCYHHEASASLPGILDSIRAAVATRSAVLAIGDFNAQHSGWGCRVDNSAGRQLAAVCEAEELTVLNSLYCLGEPTFFRGDTSSILDLALTTHPALFDGTAPDDDIPLMSDHLPLRVDVAARQQSDPRPARSYS